MSYEFLKVQSHECVYTITLNRPEVMNALHKPIASPGATGCFRCLRG